MPNSEEWDRETTSHVKENFESEKGFSFARKLERQMVVMAVIRTNWRGCIERSCTYCLGANGYRASKNGERHER